MTSLHIGSREVARYRSGADLAPTLSPRPYLHPVTTLAGVPLTEVAPEDHPHHHGVSNAVAEINGTMFWGGASYVHPHGYRMLDNHGRQVGGPVHASERTISQQVTFFARDGGHLLTEERRITATPLPGHDAWALGWHSRMRADAGELTIGSPATRGRTGAGYGGLFWRLSSAGVPTTAQVDGGGEVLGSTSPWLLLVQETSRGPVSLLLVQPAGVVLPWFVRTSGYVGAGPAVAWREHRRVAAGEHLDLFLTGVVVDGRLDPEAAAGLCTELATHTTYTESEGLS